ncbi:PspC domain-containing protein [Flavobacterium cerinum]|uniref:PspC domain-containing protein n=1 Tax=Flavobacterium cerinum TaxID=2502784 RepID=A0A3S3R1R5_9FLAO|nr:PspC domain-containing protein [Flavobacterium cerinum]RWX02507.1 PspC domain-containing protein [Flavobacterium cerinum]
MNKTVSINLGGFFFHIDEDAYQKLNRYFDAIRRSLSPDGKDEIMSDIENRIAELLSEKLKNDKQVVGNKEVDEIMAVMGQPEDYRIDEETTEQKSAYTASDFTYTKTKKFYRDSEKGMLGGVCAGLSHYFRIDPLWIRIIFIISLFVSFGTSLFIYILLWILIPKAITTTEKLEMTGEPINISNIEKKVKEEIDMITGKLQNVDYDKLGANAKSVGNGIGSVFSALFKGIAKAIGAIIAVISAVCLGGVIVMFISLLFSSSLNNTFWHKWINGFNYTETPMWVLGLAAFFALAIPLFMLFLLGLKILVDNLKPIGTITKVTLLFLWIISVAAVAYFGMSQAAEVNAEGKTVVKKQLSEISAAASDTLQIKFRYNNYYAKSFYEDTDFRFTQDSLGNDIIYSNKITFYVMKTDEASPYVQIEKIASGRSSSEARKRAEKIKYNFEFQGNTLILDNYLITDLNNKFRNQKVEVYLYLPEGMIFKCDESVKQYDDTDNSFFDLWWDSGEHFYQMEKAKVKCLDCPPDEYNSDGEIPEVPEMPEIPELPEDVHINAGGNGKIHISDENVNVHVSVDSISVRSKKRN